MTTTDERRVGSAQPAPSLVGALRAALGDEPVSDRLIDRLKMSHDGSHYLLVPQAVVVARDAADVARTVEVASRHGVGLTFRSGGTSLSGQAGTDGVLVDVRRHFRDVEVLDDGARVRCRPGATVRSVNARLAQYGRALGPDPASESACTIGGVVANNSSGMQCGTTANTYRTLDSLEFVLSSGTVVDTARPDADARLRAAEPEVWEGLRGLRDRVRADADSVRRIRHQFSMKNTMGYGVNSLLDFDEPAQILAHLMVGSEGTLGFVVSATYRTVPVHPHVATALLVFDGIDAATDALPGLIDAGARTAELMDAASLRVSQAGPVRVPALDGVHVEAHTALLVELAEEDPAELDAGVAAMVRVTAGLLGLSSSPDFGRDPAARTNAWSVRKGLYTAVAGARPAGSTALLEDVVVPMPALTDTVRGLQELCGRYGYDDAVIFGHAREANLHFMINPDLADPRQLDVYSAFTDELVDLVLGADGSLKAEHGTGRIMAPFVRRQFGDELYDVMREIKRIVDPVGVLNPGVVVSDDDQAHLRHLKPSTPVDDQVDRCVECGYCEPVCPSRDVTTTPRQRIALQRDMMHLAPADRARVEREYGYEAVETCAADSLCQGACPVGIDTGTYMKRHRAAAQTPVSEAVGERLARHWGPVLATLRAGIGVADALPAGVTPALTAAARSVLPTDLVPLVGDDLPGPGVSRRTSGRTQPGEVVLFASCTGELFGPEGGSTSAALAFLTLCDRAGVGVTIPKGVEGLCCGTVWRSKGLRRGAEAMAVRTAHALLAASDAGRIPVVTDASSCTHGLTELVADLCAVDRPDLAERMGRLTVLDAVAYVAAEVAPRLPEGERLERIVVHPTCSDQRAVGGVDALTALARRCAHDVVVPVAAGCCGFAGDRGMLHPELTAGATRLEAAEVAALDAAFDEPATYVSTNRTCELGMTRATGRPYRHVLQVLAEVTGQFPASAPSGAAQ